MIELYIVLGVAVLLVIVLVKALFYHLLKTPELFAETRAAGAGDGGGDTPGWTRGGALSVAISSASLAPGSSSGSGGGW